MKPLTTVMFICKNPACGFLATFAIVMAFAFGTPAQAGDNAFSDWLCGGVDGCWTVGLIENASLISPAHAGDNAVSEWLCGGVSGCDSGGDRSYNLLGEVVSGFITPAQAGDLTDCQKLGTCGLEMSLPWGHLTRK
ncbi:MAG: hypothetical protein V6Z81_10635 [Parvularculales bacterium]